MKKFIYIFISLLFLVSISIAGYYFLKHKNKPVPNSNQNNVGIYDINKIQWKKETFDLKRKQIDVPINLSLTIEAEIPEEWSTEIIKQEGDIKLYEECFEYVFMSSNGETQVILELNCSGWAAEYSKWPENSVTVLEQERSSHSGLITRYRIRTSEITNNYNYFDASIPINEKLDKDKHKVMNAIMIGYAPPNDSTNDFDFISANLTMLYPESDLEKECFFKISDHIAASLKIIP